MYNPLKLPARILTNVPRAALAAVSLLGLSVASLQAQQTDTWNGGSTSDAKWSTAANWGGTAPSSGDYLSFPVGAARQTNTNDFTGYTFQTVTLSAGGYNLYGNAFTVNSGLINNSNNNVYNNILLGGSQQFQSLVDNTTLVFKNNLTNNGYNLEFLGAGSSEVDGAISGAGSLTFSGGAVTRPAQLILKGANTYSGGTYVNGIGGNNSARFQIGSSTCKLGTGPVYLQNNDGNAAGQSGQLWFNSAAVITNDIYAAGIGCPESGGHLGVIRFTSGGSTVSNVILTANSRLCAYSSGDSGIVAGTISGQYGSAYNLDINVNDSGKTVPSGTLTLSGNNSYGGTTTIGGGKVILKSPGGFGPSPLIVLTAGATLDVSAATNMSVPSFVLTNLTGSGVITGNVAVAGGTTINVGPVGTAATLTLTNNSSLTLAGGATLNLDLSTNYSTVGGGVNDLIICSNLTLNGTVVINPGFFTGAPVLNQPYTVLKYSGTLSGAGSFSVASGLGCLVSTTGGKVTLTFTTAASSRNLTWTGVDPGPNYTYDWDVNKTVNWTQAGAPTVFYSRDNVTFDDTASYKYVGLPLSLTPGTMLFNNSASDYYLGSSTPGALLGAGTLTKDGTAALYLYSTNTAYDGNIVVKAGTLVAENASALGTTNGTTVITNTGTLDINALNLKTEPVIVSGAGVNGNGAIVNNGPNTQGNALQFVTLAGDATFGGSQRWDIRTTPNLLSTGGKPWKLTVNMANPTAQFSLVSATVDPALGDIDVTGGIFSFETTSTGLGNPANTVAVRGGASFQLYQATNQVSKNFSFDDTATLINNNGANTILGPLTFHSGVVTGLVNGTSLAVNGPVSGGAQLYKTGTGALCLNGTNTLPAGIYADNGGIGGSGLVNGGALVLSSNAVLSPGPAGMGSPGTFTVTSGLVLSNAFLLFDLTNNCAVAGGNDLVSLSDGLTAGTLTLDGTNTVNVNPMAGVVVPGTYTLITNGSATLVPNSAVFVPGSGLPSGGRHGSPTFDTSSPGTLLMTVPPLGDLLTWQGSASTTWSTDLSAQAWSNTVTHLSPESFYNADAVLFDDSASSSYVSVDTAVLPSAMVISNNVSSYTFGTGTGAGKISNGSSLIKRGAGNASMGLANDFTGGTFLQGGVFQLGNGNALGNPQGGAPLAQITNNATLDLNGIDLSGKTPLLYVSGTGVSTTPGAMQGAIMNGATSGSGNGVRNVVLTGNTSIGQDNGMRFDIRNGFLNGNGFTLTKVGGNYTSLQPSGVVTNLAGVVVNGGTLENQVSIGAPQVTVNAGGIFDLYVGTSPGVTQTNALVLNAGALQLDHGYSAWSGPITLNVGSNAFNLNNNLTVSNTISGPGLLSKNGGSQLLFASDNSWTGGLLINAGSVYVGNNSPAGSAGSGPITNNANLYFNRTTDLLWTNSVSGSGTWQKQNLNTLIVASTNITSSTANPAITSVGGLVITNFGYLAATNPGGQIYLAGSQATGTCVVATGGTLVGADWITVGLKSGGLGTLTLNGGTVVKQGNNNLVVGAQGATGTLTVNSGTISNSTILYLAENSGAGVGYLNLNGGLVQASQIAKRTSDAKLAQAIFNGGTLQAAANQTSFMSIDAAYVSTNGLSFDTAGYNVTNAQAWVAFTNLPPTPPATAGLTKLGLGTLTLAGTNAYTYPGSTLVNGGTLAVNARLTGNGSLTVSPSATLAGTGTNTGPATINGTLQPGSAGAAGTLTLGATVFGATATNLMDISGSTALPGAGLNDLLVVNGNLDLSSPSRLGFNFLQGLPVFGTNYTLMTYTGTLNGSVANLQLLPLPANINATLANVAGTPNAIVVSFAYNGGRPATNLVWTGDGGNNQWALGVSGDWVDSPGGAADVFYHQDNVLFDNTSSLANRTVNLAGQLAPGSVVVNSAGNYVFTNTGSITGIGQLTKQGPGTLTLATTNSYSGGTVVNNGVLQLGNNIANLGQPVNGVLCTVNAGGALDLNGLNLSVSTNVLYIAGSLSSSTGAVFASVSPGTGKGLKNVTLTADAAMGSPGARMDFNGGTLNGANHNFTKVGSSTLALWYAGGQAVNLASVTVMTNGGVLELGNGGWFALNCPVTVYSNAQINFYNLNGTFTNTPVTLNWGTWNNTGGHSTNAGVLTLAAGTTNSVSCSYGNPSTLNFLGPITGAGSLQKTYNNAQPVRLLTNNTYTGNTLVSQGVLVLGPNGSISNSPLVTVSSGATFDVSALASAFTLTANQTLGGSGSVTGNVVAASGAILQPGNGNVTGTLTLQNNLTLNSGATLSIDLTNLVTPDNGINDLIQVNGALTVAGPVTVNFNHLAAPVVGTPYVIAQSVGTLSGSVAGWTATGTRYPAAFAIVGNTIQVTFSAAAAGASSLVWQGAPAQGTVWNPGVSGWTNASGPTVFYNADSVTFDDSAPNLTVNLPGPVYPVDVTVNASQNYLFAGNGGIAGATGLTKSGPGLLTLGGAHTYSGATVVNNGTLLLNGSLGTTTVTVSGGALGGVGTIRGPVTVGAAAGFLPGAGSSLGTLTIPNTLALNGNTVMRLNVTNSLTQTNDLVAGLSSITYSGNLIVSNTGPTLALSNSFKLFNAAAYAGTFADVKLPALPAGLAWTNNLAVDGTIAVVAGAVPASPRVGTVKVTGGNLVLTGTGGPVGGGYNYNVLGSTNVALPLTNWTVLATSAFNADGSFSNNIPVTPGEPKRFYLLQLK